MQKKVLLRPEDMTQANVNEGMQLVKQLRGEVQISLTVHKDNMILRQLEDLLRRYEAGLAKAQTAFVKPGFNDLVEKFMG